MRKQSILFFILPLFLVTCKTEEKPDTLFTLLHPDRTGVDFSNNLTDTEEFNIVEYLNYYNGAGVAAGDINNDGLIDLYFASNQESNKLYLNKGNFKFKDITEKAGLACPGDWKTGVSMADVNGDDLLDIYVCQVGDYKTVQGQNYLYINNGDLTFTDRAKEYGLHFKGFSTQSLFFDYDNDGDLDMFLLNHAIHSSGSYGRASLVRYTRNLKTGDRLFQQRERDGKPYFVNVTERAGIFSSRIGYGLGVAAGDINNDGCIDIYISNDFHENDYLYVNNCDGTFTEKIRISTGHTSKSSMGNDMADFNNDGLLDIFSLDMFPDDETILKKSAGEEMMEVFDMKEQLGYYYQLSRNALQLNRGHEKFSEMAAFAGVHATDWSWAPLFFDADNDGYKDLFITNGIIRRPNDLDYLQFIEDNTQAINSAGADRISSLALVDLMPSDTIANYALKNNRDLTFTNQVESWGMDQQAFSNTSVYADLDNDGDLDFVISNLNENCFIYRNNSETVTGNNFVKIKLKGPEKNNSGIGATVKLINDGNIQIQQLVPSRGSMSSVSPDLVFGVGSAQKIDSVAVSWPGGKREVVQNAATNETIIFDIRNSQHGSEKLNDESKMFFNDITDKIEAQFKHIESNFSDFSQKPLLPHKQSTFGPRMAKGDVNGDGLEDLYICGGAGQAGQLIIQKPENRFVNSSQTTFNAHASGEEICAAFIDIDNDSDLDLFVGRGSTEHFNQQELTRDILYINDGKGNFNPSKSNIFPTSISSCVSVCDYDNDGDEDLFVGGLPEPGKYGLPGENRIYENNGNGRFKEVTNLIGKAFQNIGMTRDAIWADIDGDETKELIIVGEWMNIQVFKHEKKQFVNITNESGFEKSGGWWNRIVALDLDDDGDIDLIAGNLGLNAKIKASPEQPATMYARDFDGNGTIDPIICTYKNDRSVPFATRDDLLAQIPSLRTKFSTYKSYAKVRSISDIFSEEEINKSIVNVAHEFRSCFFENLGDGTFEKRPLPAEAQLFPVFSVQVHDFNKDGIKDILIGGNLHKAHITFGRYDAGYGLYLKGNSNLSYHAETIPSSGLLIRGEVRDIKLFNSHENELLFISKNNAPLQVLEVSHR